MASSHLPHPTGPSITPKNSLDLLQITCALSMILVALLTFYTVEHHGDTIIRWGRFLQAKPPLPRCLHVVASIDPGMSQEDLKMAVWAFFWIIWFEAWFIPVAYFLDEGHDRSLMFWFVGLDVPAFIVVSIWFYLALQRLKLEKAAHAEARLEEGKVDTVEEWGENGENYTDSSPLILSEV